MTPERPLCSECGGNGVVKIPGGISVCPRCHQDCYEPAAVPSRAVAPHDPEICICAAVDVFGLVIRGHRHPDAMRTASTIPSISQIRITQEMQGFVTSRNRFVDRREAMELQKAAGAKSAYSPDGELHGDILFSEDLY